MNVSEVMSAEAFIASPEETVQGAAQLMADLRTGVLPVGEGDRLIGVITDRDITVRVVAAGLDVAVTRIREVMSPEVYCCFEDEDVEEAAQRMSDWQVRRLPVLNMRKQFVGIVSLGDLARRTPSEISASALQGVSDDDADDLYAAASRA
ncbi:MAG TPA: CBS domain-containing protein [Steroidobacteraceae bacterium]|jgi:CBS domain-containing protein